MKRIERDLGRNFTQIRNGPRPLDLDILLYYNQTTSTACNDDDNDNNATKKGSDYNGIDWAPWMINETDPVALIVPHPRIAEREFVLAPLVDLAGRDLQHPMTIDQTTNANATFGQLLDNLLISQQHGDRDEQLGASRLIPLPLGRFLLFPPPPDSATLVMGILNVTPDSFSDGGQFNANITKAVDQAFQMVQDGARIIDIGGESTRPGAKEVSIEEQIQRIIPVIEGIRSREQQGVINSNNQKESSTLEKNSRIKIVNSDVDESRHIDVVISVDTRHAAVARAAIHAGADIVNDVSGGTFDPDMLPTVAELGVPIIMMHMRGTPETMQQMTDYGKDGDSVVDSVIESLIDRSNAASSAGIPRWMQILDVGIGFAKDFDGNLDLLKNYKKIRSETGGLPLLLGTSRKGFLGKLTGEAVASDRDYATIGSCLATICLGASWSSSTSSFGDGTSNSIFDLGCNILRVHNVKAVHQATMVMDAIVNK
jgi:dihydropteroate synthase